MNESRRLEDVQKGQIEILKALLNGHHLEADELQEARDLIRRLRVSLIGRV